MKERTEKVVQEVTKLTCDRCKRTASKSTDDMTQRMEFEEFISIKFRGGFGNNTFGDMTDVEVDLCQYCQHDLFKDFSQITQVY